MKIDYISDLHIDFWINELNVVKPKFVKQINDYVNNILPNNPGDVLIIAGDLSHYNRHSKYALKLFKNIYNNVIIVPGNHDLYLINKSQQKKYNYNSMNRLNDLKRICDELNVYFLDGNVININNVNFGGTGSWYDLYNDDLIIKWQNVMNDSKLIYDGIPQYVYSMYSSPKRIPWNTQLDWNNEYNKLKELSNQKIDVFITHIGLNIPYENEYNCFYFTDNLDLIKKSGAKIHIHGHTHENLNYVKNDIKILCNPLGYKSENTNNKIKYINI